MKTLFTLLFCIGFAAPLFAQTYAGELSQTCSAFSWREATFENSPFVTEDVTLELEWLYCGPWNGNDNGQFEVQIWIDGSWQTLFDVSDSGNGCTWVPLSFTVSASLWNSAIQSNGGSVLIRGDISDSCSPGVGCNFFSDPCFRGTTEYDYEPIEPAVAAFETTASEVCANEEFMLADLSTGSSLEYVWDYGVDAELGEMVDGIQSISYSSAGTKTISLTVSNFQGESTHTFDVVVNPSPSISVSEDVELCFGTSATFEVIGEGSISWSDQLGSSATVEVTPTETQRFFVSLTNGFSCSSEDSILYEVLGLPLVQAGMDASICRGESTLLSGSGEGELSWSNDAEAGLEQLVSPEETSSYLLSSVGENGCVNFDEVMVTVNDVPEADAGQDLHLCIGESIELLASGGDNYNWDNDLGEGETHTVSPLESTTYIVNVGSLANCFNSDTVLVTVNPVPSIDVTESTSICFGETSTISVLGEGDIDWNNNLGPQSSHDVSPEVTTTYEVQLSNEFTCFANASITITVHPVVETGLSGLSDTPYCSTDENAYNMIGSPAGGVYSGNGVEGNQFIPANAGIGALEITYSFEDEFGCEYNSTLMAEVDICDLVSEQDLLFELYPNPIQDELIIAHEGESKKIAKIQVYGLNGQLVLEKEVQGDGMPIKVNCSSLESGSYVLHLVGEGWTSNYSIIKE